MPPRPATTTDADDLLDLADEVSPADAADLAALNRAVMLAPPPGPVVERLCRLFMELGKDNVREVLAEAQALANADAPDEVAALRRIEELAAFLLPAGRGPPSPA